MLIGVCYANSQESCTEASRGFCDGVSYGLSNRSISDIEVHFRLDKSDLELDYMGNDQALRTFARMIDSIGISRIDSVVIVSQSSPEGVYEHNLKLADRRARAMRSYVLDRHPELSEKLCVHSDGESWARLREYVKADTRMKQSTIRKVLSVIDSDVNIGTKKWRMQQLPVYRYLLATYYPRIRNSVVCILYYREESAQIHRAIVKVSAAPQMPESVCITPAMSQLQPAAMETPKPEGVSWWTRRLYLKTNAIGWGLAIANIGAEIDIAEHWSFALPVYYSALNYFTTSIKFRTLAVQPELRYWFNGDNQNFFLGAHFGYAQYNVAVNGDFRYQDHRGKSPALGGGLSAGYRMPISRDNKWHIEFSLGAGVYTLHYDKFYNVTNGKLVDTCRKTYFGIDNAAVSISYRFDLNKCKR